MLFGPPGAGKGTHSPKIVDKMNVPSLATGDMLREAVAQGTEVGLKAKALMESGGLVGDDIVVGIIKDRILHEDCATGFILDGFPRTLAQANMLDALLSETGDKVESVIEFNVPDAVLEERICGRWIHKNSGRSYHVKFNPPKSLGDKVPSKETMLDNETGEPCMQRADDTAEALVKRLKSYHAETVPILTHYKTVAHKIKADQAIDLVWAAAEAATPTAGVIIESKRPASLPTPDWNALTTPAAATYLKTVDMDTPTVKNAMILLGHKEIPEACMNALSLREDKPVLWMLTFLVDLLREDSSVYGAFDAGCKRLGAQFTAPLTGLISRLGDGSATEFGDSDRAYASDKAAWLLSSMVAHVPWFFSQGQVSNLLDFVFDRSAGLSEVGKLEAVANLLKSDLFRCSVWNHRSCLLKRLIIGNRGVDGVKSLACVGGHHGSGNAAEGSVVYKRVFAIWMLSCEPSLAGELKDLGVVQMLKDVIETSRMEKVVRIALTVMKNMLSNKEMCATIVASNVLDAVQNLEYEKWNDAELYDDIREVSSDISNKVQETSTFDSYEQELKSGNMTWGHTHTTKFWAENIKKVEKNDFSVLKTLCALLHNADADVQTLAVAVHDVGEVIALHPGGKKKVAELGIKERVMDFMGTSGQENSELRREALLCCQKIMLSKWQDAADKVN